MQKFKYLSFKIRNYFNILNLIHYEQINGFNTKSRICARILCINANSSSDGIANSFIGLVDHKQM
jgi:hypothetical protein